MTSELLDQRLVQQLLPDAEVPTMCGMIAALDKLRHKAPTTDELEWLREHAEGAMTVDRFLRIMSSPQMARTYTPRPMRLVNSRWGELKQRRLLELATSLRA